MFQKIRNLLRPKTTESQPGQDQQDDQAETHSIEDELIDSTHAALEMPPVRRQKSPKPLTATQAHIHGIRREQLKDRLKESRRVAKIFTMKPLARAIRLAIYERY